MVNARLQVAFAVAPFLYTGTSRFDRDAWTRGQDRFPDGAALHLVEASGQRAAVPDFFASADAEVSFDGKRLLFSGRRRREDRWQIWEIRLAGGAPRRITTTKEDCIRPLYLPDEEVVYARQYGGSFQLEAAHLAGGEPTRLSYAVGSVLPLQVLRDGRILFEGPHPVGGRELYTVYSDGSGVESVRCDHRKLRREGRQLDSRDIVFLTEGGLARFTSAQARQVEMRAPAGEMAGPVAEIRPGEWLIALKPKGSPAFAIHRWAPEGSGRPAPAARGAGNAVYPVVALPREVPLRHPSSLHGRPGANLLCLNAYESPLAIQEGAIATVRVYSQDAEGKPVRLGEAPVETDGSFYVQLPTEQPLRIELADRAGRPLASEKGFFWMRQGEQRICVGCHAGPERTPENAVPKVLLRSTIPVKIE